MKIKVYKPLQLIAGVILWACAFLVHFMFHVEEAIPIGMVGLGGFLIGTAIRY